MVKGMLVLIVGAVAAIFGLGAAPAARAQAAGAQLPYQNPDLPVEKRVDDLLGRLNSGEKISLMMMDSPAVPRLGIPAYHWWNEALHGYARHGIATVFPQAIGLAATWDDDLHLRVASVISTEARAHHEEALRKGERGIYSGLTIWSPNINIFRDPRWGRGQETYGEDPFLTGRMGVAFIKGLQGDDPNYFKTIGTVKHFAVHSGPESQRFTFSAAVGKRDIWDTYLPAFEACVREGHAQSAMGAYSSINGTPSSGDKWLLTDVLRKTWGFSGVVVSDVDSVGIIYTQHHFVDSPQAAAAKALTSGLDCNSGSSFNSLNRALQQKLIAEADLNRGLRNVLTARFRLGEFDPPARVPYSKITYADNATPASDAVALEAARESMVLLRNEGGVLPFNKNIKRVAVIGPNAADGEVLLGNYNGFPLKPMTILEGIQQKLGEGVEVLYDKGCDVLEQSPFLLAMVPQSALASGGESGLKGEYFTGKDLGGTPVLTRTDPFVDFDWSRGMAIQGLAEGECSVRWTGKITAPADGRYRISVSGDEIFRLFLDGKQVVDSAPETADNTVQADTDLQPGQSCALRLEYVKPARARFLSSGIYRRKSTFRLAWQKLPSTAQAEAAAAALARQADAVILVMGINARVEGEDMPLRIQGFMGGDRTRLDLPGVQQRLITAVAATGKPTALVVLSGSAIALGDLPRNVAILQAWYPGQHPDAVADVLFGDYNPAGRLPITIYRSVADLPPFTDYNMKGRTYRFFKGEPLFSFGDGLSYTTFAYDEFKIDQAGVAAGQPVKVSVRVKNSGARDGDEVVQLYLTHENAPVEAPLRALKGFKRVGLKAGEAKTVEFTLTPSQLALIDEAGERKVYPGSVKITVGGNQKGAVSGELKITGQPTAADYGYTAPLVK